MKISHVPKMSFYHHEQISCYASICSYGNSDVVLLRQLQPPLVEVKYISGKAAHCTIWKIAWSIGWAEGNR